jgi:hypothetical protein
VINCRCDYEILTDYSDYESNVPLSQMFEDEEKNKIIGQFEKENNKKPNEFATVKSNGETLLSNYTNNSPNEVHLPDNIKNYGREKGIDLLLHNHPNDIALISGGDVYNSIAYRIKELTSTTKGNYNGRLINNNQFSIQNLTKLEERAVKYQYKFNEIENEMKINFATKNPKYANLNPKSQEFKKGLTEFYQKEENMLPYYKKFQNALPNDMELKLYNKKLDKYI